MRYYYNIKVLAWSSYTVMHYRGWRVYVYCIDTSASAVAVAFDESTWAQIYYIIIIIIMYTHAVVVDNRYYIIILYR